MGFQWYSNIGPFCQYCISVCFRIFFCFSFFFCFHLISEPIFGNNTSFNSQRINPGKSDLAFGNNVPSAKLKRWLKTFTFSLIKLHFIYKRRFIHSIQKPQSLNFAWKVQITVILPLFFVKESILKPKCHFIRDCFEESRC